VHAALETSIHRQPKLGETAETCEDVFALQRRVLDDAESVRIALSDGATMTSFARTWAQILTGWFTQRRFHDEASFRIALRIMRRYWSTKLPADLPWHSEEKVAQGAGATLLGVDVVSNGDGVHWKALAVGDTCLLSYAGTHIEHSFPLATSEEFDYTPGLISSALDAEIPVPAFATGELAQDGVLVLATDALAKFLIERDGQIDPLELAQPDGRDGRFDQLRTDGSMKNDDIALAVVRLGP
jgi:hypothetical protein